MDSTEYDKIVDKILQFRGKIPQYGMVNNGNAKKRIKHLLMKVDELIFEIDLYAHYDAQGWIK